MKTIQVNQVISSKININKDIIYLMCVKYKNPIGMYIYDDDMFIYVKYK